jgi:hypothetical protein
MLLHTKIKNEPTLTSDILKNSKMQLFLFKCGVCDAKELFLLSNPLSVESMILLSKKMREMYSKENQNSENIFYSIYNILVPPSQITSGQLISQHEQWLELAINNGSHFLSVAPAISSNQLEENCEYVYFRRFEKCYTIVYRCLSIIQLEKDQNFLNSPQYSFSIDECNEILSIIRNDLKLSAKTILDIYPQLICPNDLKYFLEKEKNKTRKTNQSDFQLTYLKVEDQQ